MKYEQMDELFPLRSEQLNRLAISRAQKQFENDEEEKMKEWLRSHASILINAGNE